MDILLEQLTHANYIDALSVNRDDIPEEWVDRLMRNIRAGEMEKICRSRAISDCELTQLNGRFIIALSIDR